MPLPTSVTFPATVTTSVTSVLLMGPYEIPPMIGEIEDVDSTAITYRLCPEGLEDGKCLGTPAYLTQGPWAYENLPPGAAETGDLDFRREPNKKARGVPFSVHCAMSRTSALMCYDVLEDEKDGEITTRTHDIKKFGDPEFQYAEVTLTAGLEKLSAKATDATSEISAETGSTSKSPSAAEETGTGNEEEGEEDANGENGVAFKAPSMLAAAFVAGATMFFAL